MAMDMHAAIDRIQAILEANTTPSFNAVYPMEPMGLPIDPPVAAFWYIGDGDPPEGYRTLGNRMREERFRVQVYWPVRVERTSFTAFAYEIADCKQALCAAFAGDAFLDGGGATRIVDAVEIGPVEVGYSTEQGEIRYRVMRFDLALRDLNAEEETG